MSFLHSYIISENFIKFSWYWPIPAWRFFGLHKFQSSETFGFCQRAFTDVLFLFVMDRIIFMSKEVGKVNIDGCAPSTFAVYNFKKEDWHRRAKISWSDVTKLFPFSFSWFMVPCLQCLFSRFRKYLVFSPLIVPSNFWYSKDSTFCSRRNWPFRSCVGNWGEFQI